MRLFRASRRTLKEQGTRGTREAKQEHMRGTTGGQKMYSRGTCDEQQRYNRGPTPNREYIIPNLDSHCDSCSLLISKQRSGA